MKKIINNLMERDNNYKKFLLIWLGQLIASIGSGLTSFGLGVYVFQQSNSAVNVSIVTLCAFLPSILLSPIAGVFADRFDRRLMMIIGDSFSAVGLVVMLLIMSFGDIKIWQICLCVALSSIFTSLLDPAYKATVSDLLTEEQYAKAGGLVQLAGSAKFLLSPLIGGVLLSVSNIKMILIIDICTLILTVSAAVIVKKNIQSVNSHKKRESFIRQIAVGWKVITDRKGVIVLILVTSLVTFYVGFVQTLFTPLILGFEDSSTLGMIESISAVGMLISSLFIGIFSIKKNYVNIMTVFLGIAGIFISLLGITMNVLLLCLFGFLFFFTLPFINTSIEVLIRKSISNDKQGRVWGLVGIISQIGYIMSYMVSGVLADYIFNPLLEQNGKLVSTVGSIIGVGTGRGIGLLFIVVGISVIVLAILIFGIKSIRKLENKHDT